MAINIKRPGKATVRRRALRLTHFADEHAWTGANERGWFKAPRTLPLILALLASKHISGSQDPSRVYLDLLARHVDEGVVHMSSDEDHAYSSGYEGPRGVRTWRERMQILANVGFIKVKSIGTRRWAYVLLVHPNTVIERLREQGLVPDAWWDAYRDRQAETGEVQPVEVAGTDGVAAESEALAPTAVAEPAGVQVVNLDSDIPF